MKILAHDPKTGENIEALCQANDLEDIKNLLEFDLSEEMLKKRLNNLNISSDAKSMLFTLAKTTINVGSAVIKIGRKVLDIIIGLIRDFPTATWGVIFGAVLGYLVSSIPIVGLVIGPIVTPLAMAIGFAFGGIQDISNKALAQRVATSMMAFDGLKPQV